MKKAVRPCLETRLLWALDLPSSTLLPNHKDMIRNSMETVDATTIKEAFDMLKAGHWLKRATTPGTPPFETSTSLKDIREHWADDFKGDALKVWGRRLILAEENYAKTIDIAQSSGMGKSRLVSEMAKEVMTISFVLRKPGDRLPTWGQGDFRLPARRRSPKCAKHTYEGHEPAWWDFLRRSVLLNPPELGIKLM